MKECKRCKDFFDCEYRQDIEYAIDRLPIKDDYETETKPLYDNIEKIIAKYCSEYNE